jgi:hypothetical protein
MTVPCKRSVEITIEKDVQAVFETYSDFSGKAAMEGNQISAENVIMVRALSRQPRKPARRPSIRAS